MVSQEDRAFLETLGLSEIINPSSWHWIVDEKGFFKHYPVHYEEEHVLAVLERLHGEKAEKLHKVLENLKKEFKMMETPPAREACSVLEKMFKMREKENSMERLEDAFNDFRSKTQEAQGRPKAEFRRVFADALVEYAARYRVLKSVHDRDNYDWDNLQINGHAVTRASEPIRIVLCEALKEQLRQESLFNDAEKKVIVAGLDYKILEYTLSSELYKEVGDFQQVSKMMRTRPEYKNLDAKAISLIEGKQILFSPTAYSGLQITGEAAEYIADFGKRLKAWEYQFSQSGEAISDGADPNKYLTLDGLNAEFERACRARGIDPKEDIAPFRGGYNVLCSSNFAPISDEVIGHNGILTADSLANSFNINRRVLKLFDKGLSKEDVMKFLKLENELPNMHMYKV